MGYPKTKKKKKKAETSFIFTYDAFKVAICIVAYLNFVGLISLRGM